MSKSPSASNAAISGRLLAALKDEDSLRPLGKRRRLFGAWLRRRPLWCAWQVTYRCNFRCRMCPYWRKSAEAEVQPSLEDFRLGSSKLSTFGSILISLAGGEPTVRGDLLDIIRIVSRHHFTFMTTNGYLVDRNLARELFRAGLWGASVSIDFADAARHDASRGRQGAFDRAAAALEYLCAERTASHQRVNLMATLMHDNLDDMEGLLKLAANAGANFMVQPYSAMKMGDKSFLPPRESAGRLTELHNRHKNFLSNRVFLEKIGEYLDGGVKGCAAGRAFFNIDTYMKIAICVENRARPVASLRDDPPERILRKLREGAKGNDCARCWYNCRGEVESLGSIRGLIHALPIYLTDSFKNNPSRVQKG